VRYRLAGGIIGILAAVNEEVEWSYRVNLALILVVVFLLSYATYVSVWGALIVMLPSLVAQPLSEAVMYLFGIDMNINSLPVARSASASVSTTATTSFRVSSKSSRRAARSIWRSAACSRRPERPCSSPASR